MTTLPDAVEVVDLPDGVRYRLPRRDLGGLRYLGCFSLGLGLFVTGFAVTWAVGMGGGLGGGALHWIGLLVALFAVPFVLAGLAMIGLGLAVVVGRSEVEISGGRLWAIERVGLLRVCWRRPIERVRKLVVGFGVTENDRPVTSGPLADLAAIKVESEGAGPLLLAVGYRRELVAALAAELARRCHLAAEASMEVAPRIEVTEEKWQGRVKPGFEERTDRPAGSTITLDESATGVTLEVPRAGLRQGSKGLFPFGVVWCGFMALLTGFIVFSGGLGDPEGFWIFVAVISLFWLVGIGMLLAGINMGRRRAVLAVVGNQLLVLQTGLLGGQRREWPRDQLADVRSGPTGMEVNDVPILELQIIPREGKKVGLLGGRDEAELAWMATVLRRALGINAECKMQNAEPEPPIQK